MLALDVALSNACCERLLSPGKLHTWSRKFCHAQPEAWSLRPGAWSLNPEAWGLRLEAWRPGSLRPQAWGLRPEGWSLGLDIAWPSWKPKRTDCQQASGAAFAWSDVSVALTSAIASIVEKSLVRFVKSMLSNATFSDKLPKASATVFTHCQICVAKNTFPMSNANCSGKKS